VTRGYIGIGSNIDREKHIAAGIEALKKLFGQLILSSTYESEPVGFVGDAFYNLVAGFDSELGIQTVIQQLRQIEYANGRELDSKKFSARSLDLDLLLYGNLIINEGKLQIPRKDIEHYPFVLEPLAEIAPKEKHPILLLSYAELWRQMPKNKLQQRRINFI
jgi:2-amino-4-hydroxy-6-hydroxymethyldihydropteridine diphosphokinase